MPATIYATTATAIGELVPAFREHGYLVFFGKTAPEELHDFCILHDVEHGQGFKLLRGFAQGLVLIIACLTFQAAKAVEVEVRIGDGQGVRHFLDHQ